MRGIEHVPWLYDRLMDVVERVARLRAWRSELVRGLTGRVLEIGTGTGRNLAHYGEGIELVAIDLDPGLLRVARERSSRAPLAAASVEALPFGDSVFAGVVSSLVLCSVDDPRAGLAEVRRVLAPGGEMRMLEHVRSGNRLLARLQDLAQPAWTWLTGGCRPNRPTESTVESSGFRIDATGHRARGVLRLFAALPDDGPRPVRRSTMNVHEILPPSSP